VIPAASDGAWVSPSSTDGDVLCFSLGSQAQGFLVHLPTLTGTLVLDGSRFAFGLSALQWTSWSPDGAFGLAAHYYESRRELFVIATHENTARRVPGITLAKENEEQVFDLDSVKWDTSEQFRMRVTINCNPFTSPDTCADDERKKTLRVYDLVINAQSLDVSSTVQAEPSRSAEVPAESAGAVTPSFDCSKARTATEKLICREPGLASMERDMVSAYKQAIEQASAEQKATISRDHLQWFKQYARTCDAAGSEIERKDCVTTHLRNRIQALRGSGLPDSGLKADREASAPPRADRMACVYDPISNVRQLELSTSKTLCRIDTRRMIRITGGPFVTREGTWWATDTCGQPGFIANDQIHLDVHSCQ
jgi:uncharacterized protein YecT (DUF1311 family)